MVALKGGRSGRLRWATVAVALALSVIGALVTPAGANRVEAASYVGGNDFFVAAVAYFATGADPTCRGVAGACFAVQPGDRQVSVEVHDITGQTISGLLTFFDGRRPTSQSVVLCGSATANVPAGATMLKVQTWPLPRACDGRSGTATSGIIRAEFS